MSVDLFGLPDIILLEIFGYLSCEDVLYAFADIHNVRLMNLLREHGAFEQICLSSKLSRHQNTYLSDGIWCYDLVRSFVCKEVFSDHIACLTPCQVFPSLTDLRVYFLTGHDDALIEFVISHASTLTHLSIKLSEQSYILDHHERFFRTILPHLSQLKLLDTSWKTRISIVQSELINNLQSLKHLITYGESLSDVYLLMENGVLPRLQSLRIFVQKSVIERKYLNHSFTSNLHMPNLKIFILHIANRKSSSRNEEQVIWEHLERLISDSVMPCLRRLSLLYTLQTKNETTDICQSSFFKNNHRDISLQIGFYLYTETLIDLSKIDNLSNISSTKFNQTIVQFDSINGYTTLYTWFTSSWSKWLIFFMEQNRVAPRNGVRIVLIRASNILLDSFGKLYPDADVLMFDAFASLSTMNSLITQTPFLNIRRLQVVDVNPGLEYLLDGVRLPHLQSLHGPVLPLFVAFASRTNQMKTLDTIDHLLLVDQSDGNETCFSFKQWHIVLDVLPRLKALIIQIGSPKCPPIGLAELFLSYIRLKIRSSLTLFSCFLLHSNEKDNKKNFVNHLLETVVRECLDITIASHGPTNFDLWM